MPSSSESGRSSCARQASSIRDFPEAFDTSVLRALHRTPAKRFPDVRAFARALLPFASAATKHALERDFFERPGGGAKGLSSSAFRSAATVAETRHELPPRPSGGAPLEDRAP